MLEFSKANKKQIEAINYTDGPLLIIAGPGTGKTYTLINRTLNLIVNKGVSPSRILLATFTEKAARELITRLSDALSKHNIEFNPNEMYIGTFHSICLRILKDNIGYADLKKNFSLKDQFDQQYFIYQHLNNFTKIEKFDEFIEVRQSYWDKSQKVANIINKLTEEMIERKKLSGSKNEEYNFFANVLEEYDKLRHEYNFVDFPSVQVEAYKLLTNNKEVAENIINNIDYVMIDEYQDTNHIQEELSLLFSSKLNNLCVVGDDDQAIYRFRGSTVRNILEFEKHFDNCKRIELVENYRSHKDIVEFYNTWMKTTQGRQFDFDWGKNRFNKTILASKNTEVEAQSVIKICENGETALFSHIYEFIKDLRKNNKISDLNQITFLFKSVKNDMVVRLAEYLEDKDISIYSPRSSMFFDRPEIQLLIGTLIMLFPKFYARVKKKDEKLKHLVGYYDLCLKVADAGINKSAFPELCKWLQFRITDHMNLSNSLDYALSGLVYQMLEFKPFSLYLDCDLNGKITDSRTVRNLSLFIQLIIKFESLNNISVFTEKNIEKVIDRFFTKYMSFLIEGGIGEYEDEEEYAPSGCVSFMTIHQSKGLQFPIVFIGSQNTTPRSRAEDGVDAAISELSSRKPFEKEELIKYFDFWRLFYVGFSRAQSLLIPICDSGKRGSPSKYFERFYEELPSETDISKFNFEEVKKTDLKYSYSFTSDINVYLVCPRQYKYFKLLGFTPVRVGSTLFGTVVHETIEDVHKAVLRGERNLINEENVQKWFEINYETASRLQNSYLNLQNRQAAVKQVLSYVNRAQSNWDAIYDAEKAVSLSRDNYILTGKVDLLKNDKGKYEILDFKTEKKPDMQKEKGKIDRVKMQLEAYAYLIEKTYNIKIDGMQAYYTSEKEDSNPYISFKRSDENINKTLSVFDNVINDIENNKFNKTCSDQKVCSNCDLRFYCKRR